MRVRKLQKRDVPAIIKIGRSVKEFDISKLGKFWTKSQLEKLAISKVDVCLVAEQDGKIVGFTITTANRATGKVTLENGWVSPHLRSNDVGTALIKQLLQKLKAKKYSYIMGFTLLPEAKLGFLKRNSFVIGKKGTWVDKIL